MNPLLASPEVAGFPMTIFERGTPLAAIWKTAELGQVPEDVLRRLLQVVYSLVPSKSHVNIENNFGIYIYIFAYGYRTERQIPVSWM